MATDLTLKTNRLILRPFERSDLNDVLGYYSLPEVQRYLDWKARDKLEAKAAFEAMRKQSRLTRPGDILTLAIARKTDGSLWTWGNNFAGQLGDGTTEEKLSPMRIGTVND